MAQAAPNNQNQPVAYLDQINISPVAASVQVLSSQIAFLAPTNLRSWAFLTLGLLCSQPLQPPILFAETGRLRGVLGFYFDDTAQATPEYMDLQEFVSHIVARDFTNPRLAELCDLHPQHPSTLDLDGAGIDITKAQFLHTVVTSTSDESATNESTTAETTQLVGTPAFDMAGSWWFLKLPALPKSFEMAGAHHPWKSSFVIYDLVRHGISFRTLAGLASESTTLSCCDIPMPSDFKPLSTMTKESARRNAQDYAKYSQLRQNITRSPHGNVAYRMGGIAWRLAMESIANFDDVIDEIMDGPSDTGPTARDSFEWNGIKYYDNCLTAEVEASYWPTSRSWSTRRWAASRYVHGSLMWNHRDEESFQSQHLKCIEGTSQPLPQLKWKKNGISKHKFDIPYKEYCAMFLESKLGS
ncbi:hypothetical protein BYT27DRAFT_7215024 [Phlegmacium glaucopus]|nr:hypothetical protein BYT27DRAFT_7215024 [Phlegmacium glaucopus]